MIFVFGSNLQGIHGAGAALFAREHHGAVVGQGEGMQGTSYALPTCSAPGVPLPLRDINVHVQRFLDYAAANPKMQFQVTRVGCGLAGYRDEQIAPMFRGAAENVWLPAPWLNAMLPKLRCIACNTAYPYSSKRWAGARCECGSGGYSLMGF